MALKTISSRIGSSCSFRAEKEGQPKNIQPRQEVAKKTAFVPVTINSEQPAPEQPVGLFIELSSGIKVSGILASNVPLAKTLIEALI